MYRAFWVTAFVIAVVVSAGRAAASGNNEIYNFRTNQCLQPVNGSTDQGTAIIQEPCNGGDAQKWKEVSVGGNIVHYMNVLSGLCLDARGPAKNGTPIQAVDVQQNQQRKLATRRIHPGRYSTVDLAGLWYQQLLPRHTRGAADRRALHADLPLQRNRGAAMVDRSITDKPIITKEVNEMRVHRHMTLRLTVAIAAAAIVAVAPPAWAEDDIVKLVSSANGKCLQPVNGSHNQGDAIVQETCNGSAAQQWTVHLVSSTKAHLINRASGLCLDARGKAVNGTPIQQWTCNSITNENWGFGITNNLLASAVSDTWSHCIATPGNQDGLAMELRACMIASSQLWIRPNG